MSWIIGFSRNHVLKLQNKLGIFHIVLQEKSHKFSLTVLQSQNLRKLQDLDAESQISQYEWTLYNRRRKVFLSYRSDIKKKSSYRVSQKRKHLEKQSKISVGKRRV